MKTFNPKDSQNFITSTKHVRHILNKTTINQSHSVFEIGSGKGHFTKELGQISQSVTSIEIDSVLATQAITAVENYPNVRIINEDFLLYDLTQDQSEIIFGNIPFNLTTAIVKKIAFESKVNSAFIIVEKAFAQKIQSTNRALGLLLMNEWDIKVLSAIPSYYYHPKPRVKTVLIEFQRRKPWVIEDQYPFYETFVYQWVHQEYRQLFTKNQLKQAMKHAQVDDLNYLTMSQVISMFNSYLMFKGI